MTNLKEQAQIERDRLIDDLLVDAHFAWKRAVEARLSDQSWAGADWRGIRDTAITHADALLAQRNQTEQSA